MRRARRLSLILAVLLVLAGAIFLAGRSYLGSRRAAVQVAARLEAAYQMPVELLGVDVGLHDTTLRGLRLHEVGAPTGQPWAVVEQVDADVSLWDALRGEANPRRLRLRGADLVLRFDRDSKLLTRFPTLEGGTESPIIQLEGGRLTLQQQERPDMVITGLEGTLQPQEGRLVYHGTVADPTWGDWTADAQVDLGTSVSSLTLTTRRPVHVTPELLDRLPFVSPVVWKHVRTEADTPVELTVRLDPAHAAFHYRVAVQPVNAWLQVPSIDLRAEQGQGKIVVEDNVVRLTDLTGRMASGTIRTDGTLDFQADPSVLAFDVKAEGLVLAQLPASWSLPKQIDGKLTGTANLKLTLVDGTVRTSGNGRGVIQDARLVGLPAQPIELKLHADGVGFQFTALRTGGPADWRAFAPLPALTVALLGQPPEPPVVGQPLSVQIVHAVHEGTRRFLDALTAGGARVVGVLSRLAERRPPAAKPSNYLQVNLGLQDVDLGQLIERLQVTLPFKIGGRVTIQVQAEIPLDAARDFKAYRFQGTATLPRFTLEGLELEQVRAHVVYADGILRLEEFQGQVPAPAQPRPGSFAGTARLEVIPAGDLSARLTLERIPLARVLAAVPGGAGRAEGSFAGNVALRAPTNRLRDPATWEGSGALHAERLEAQGWRLQETRVDLLLKGGIVAATGLRASLEGTPVQGQAELTLADPYRFSARVALERGSLAALQRLAPELRPPVAILGTFTVAAVVQGTLTPFTLDASGSGVADNLQVDTLELESLRFLWALSAERLKLTDIRAALYGGELTGTAQVPLGTRAPGSVELRFQQVDVGDLTKAVPALPIQLDGRATGTFQGILTAGGAADGRRFTGRLDLDAPRLIVQGIPTERLVGNLEYRQGSFAYRFEGQALGGRFNLNGRYPPPAKPAEGEPQGRLQVEEGQLAQLWEVLGVQAAVGPLRGVINLDLPFRHEGPNHEPVGNGRFVLSRLRWGETDLAGRIQGTLRLTPRELRLRELTGVLGQGLLRGQVAVNLRQVDRSWFNLTLEQVESSRLLAPWPALAEYVEGPVQLQLRGNFGREWIGSGSLHMSRGRVDGVEVTEWRVPLTFQFAPNLGRGQIEIPETHAQVGLGRAVGRASVGWGFGTRLEGNIRFFGVELQPLLRRGLLASQIGSNKLTGRLTFSGTDMHSLNDLTAALDATMAQTQVVGLPVLPQLLPYVAPGLSATSGFRGGAVKARLARGLVRIEFMTLEHSAYRLLIQGTITVQGGRLDLDVWANTGRYSPDAFLLQRLGLRIPVAGPIPLVVLMEANSYLSNRVIHLRVTGTLRSPVIQIEPVSLLTEEAVRFFLNRLLPPVP